LKSIVFFILSYPQVFKLITKLTALSNLIVHKGKNSPAGSKWEKFKQVFKRTLFCLITILFFKLCISPIIHLPETLSPFTNKIDDFELSDLCFAYFHKKVADDTNIVIVNSNTHDAKTIALNISRIEKYKPKAIGLDMNFYGPALSKDSKDFADTIIKYKDNLVLAEFTDKRLSKLPFYKTLNWKLNGIGGFNFGYVSIERVMHTKRNFTPYPFLGTTKVDAFAVKIIRIAYGNDKLTKLNDREREEELINYRNGFFGTNRYTVIDSVLNDSMLFHNKIVLFGNDDSTSIVDLYYTPLNKGFGRSIPDMHGIEYHAHIISTILNNDYIDPINRVSELSIIFLSCFCFMFFLNWLLKWHGLYHLVVDVLFLLILVPVSIYLSYLSLEYFKVKTEPTHFVVPLFLCGIILHLYEPFVKMVKWFVNLKSKKN